MQVACKKSPFEHISYSLPKYDSDEFFTLFDGEKWDELSEKFLVILEDIEPFYFININEENKIFVKTFMVDFLYFFSHTKYFIDFKYGLDFIKFSPLISNLVTLTEFLGNTDIYVANIMASTNKNLIKVLTLYSARNNIVLDYDTLRNTNSTLFDLWYCLYFKNYHTYCLEKNVLDNIKKHMAYSKGKKIDFDPQNLSDFCYGATYLDPELDQIIKENVNTFIANNSTPSLDLECDINKRNKKKIAIFSLVFLPGHSVYRNLWTFISSLKDSYDLTLFCRTMYKSQFEEEKTTSKIFKEIICLDDPVNLEIMKGKDFVAIYYPDVGMDNISLILSNFRLAPIQACGVGHSSSTHGSKIDYYISGIEAEIPENPEINYTERLVLLPGNGIINEKINYVRKGGKKGTTNKLLINCPWTLQKFNYAHLDLVKEIHENARIPIEFRFFIGGCETMNIDTPIFVALVEKILGDKNVKFFLNMPYNDFMEMLEEGDICIDSYHFGGCNIITDNLYLRKPTVTFEGKKWYNRIGSHLLKSIGLGELVARNDREYVTKVLELINNKPYRTLIQKHLDTSDIDSILFDDSKKKYFKQAIDYLIENHEKLQKDTTKSPIIIS